MTFAIISTILLIFAALALVITGRLVLSDQRQRRLVLFCRIVAGAIYALILVPLILWIIQAYEGGNVTLAVWTYIVAWLMYGGILALIGIPKASRLFYIPMVLTFLLSIAFIVLQVYLSKTIMQPGLNLLVFFK